jgi:K+-transporting ATPase, A chain
MAALDYGKILLFVAVLVAATPVLGRYMTRVFDGRLAWLAPLERLIYRSCGIDAGAEQRGWTTCGRCWPSMASAWCW